jgi:hypothetical protein
MVRPTHRPSNVLGAPRTTNARCGGKSSIGCARTISKRIRGHLSRTSYRHVVWPDLPGRSYRQPAEPRASRKPCIVKRVQFRGTSDGRGSDDRSNRAYSGDGDFRRPGVNWHRFWRLTSLPGTRPNCGSERSYGGDMGAPRAPW